MHHRNYRLHTLSVLAQVVRDLSVFKIVLYPQISMLEKFYQHLLLSPSSTTTA